MFEVIDWPSGRDRHCQRIVRLELWGRYHNIPVDRVPDYSNGTKNGFANGYGTGDVGIRIILELFGIMGSPELLALSERNDQ